MNRRNFTKSVGAALGVGLAASLAGCAEPEDDFEEEDEGEAEFDSQKDPGEPAP